MLDTHTHTQTHTYTHYYFVGRFRNIFLCINVSFIIIVYKVVFVRRLVLNVHFVRAVLQPLIVSYLLLILLHILHSLASFISYFIHVPILCLYYVYIMPYSTFKLNTLYQTKTLNLWGSVNIKPKPKYIKPLQHKIVGDHKYFHSYYCILNLPLCLLLNTSSLRLLSSCLGSVEETCNWIFKWICFFQFVVDAC